MTTYGMRSNNVFFLFSVSAKVGSPVNIVLTVEFVIVYNLFDSSLQHSLEPVQTGVGLLPGHDQRWGEPDNRVAA